MCVQFYGPFSLAKIDSINNIYIVLKTFFFFFWLCWVFVSVRGLSLVAASRGHSSSRCVGLSLSWPLLLRSIGSRHAGSVVVAHGPCCSAACGIFPDQGSNSCPLHWQADSQPLCHQGSPENIFFNIHAFLTTSLLADLEPFTFFITVNNAVCNHTCI